MKFQDFFENVFYDAKKSFIYGTTASCIQNFITKNENENFLYKQMRGIKDGIEYTQFNIVNSSLNYIMKSYDVKSYIRKPSSLFLSSYLIGLRNGKGFAVKNGIISLSVTYLNKFFNELTSEKH